MPGKPIILGDFNFHLDEPHRSEVAKFLDILDSYGLEQHVDKPTHISKHILDLVVTRDSEDLGRFWDTGCYFGLDHKMVSCVMQQRKPPPLKTTSSVRN